jgi:two-component system, cell cycle sensor histidine kinase and response regulator CckA
MNERPSYEELEKRVTELEQQVEQYRTRELKFSPEKLSVIVEAFHCTPICETFENAAKHIFDHCKLLTGATSGYVALLSEDGEENEVLFLDAGGSPCDVDPNLPMPIRGLREIAYKTKKVAYENSFPGSPWMKFMPEGHMTLENVLFAPLNIENKTVGVIGIANKPGGFNEQDVHISKSLGDLAAVALTYAKSQSQLKNSEELFRTTFDQAAVGIAQITTDGRFKRVNSKFANIIGYSNDELTMMSFDKITYPEDLNKERKIIDLVIKGEIDSFEIEKRYIHKNGHLVWIKLFSNVVRDEKNNINYAVASVIDITQQKIAETALLESEEKHRQITESMNEVFWLRSANNSEMLYVSPAYEKVWGRSCQSLYENPQSFIDSVYIEDKPAVFAEFEKYMNGERFDLEYRITRPDKSIRWIRAQSFPVINNAGDIIKHTGIAMDITKRKQAEEDLDKSLSLIDAIMDSLEEGLLVVNIEGNVIRHNRAFSDLWKITPELESSSDEMLLEYVVSQLDDPKAFLSKVTQLYESPEESSFDEIAFSDGRVFERFSQPLWQCSQITGRIWCFRNITDRKRTEEQREKLQAQLNHAQKLESIGSLAGGIAHDFNNLLFPIVGLSEMMLETFPLGSPEHHDAQQICKAGNRGRELVQQILSFSRQSDYQLIPVHIQKILKEVLKLCRATIPADIEITQDIKTDCGPVMADPTQIHQIAMNLITNAYHAVEPAGGTISIRLREMYVDQKEDLVNDLLPGRYAMLTVSDTGTGIDPAIINKIFDPYFTTKKKGRGTGLGLSTVYGIVKSFSGEIRVHSGIGKGASFQIYLPILEKTADDIPEGHQQAIPTGIEHILLVDDEKPIVNLEKQMLDRLGYTITCFTSSVDALAAFKADPTRYNLVITDMSMPHLNGIQLAKGLIAVNPDIPIIICTGFSERINKGNTFDMGIKGFLMKPVTIRDLAYKVREILD